MGVSEVRKLKQLEDENGKLKRLVADLTLDKTMTASVASKEFGRYLDTAQREPVIVTKKTRPVAVTVSFQDWEGLMKLHIERCLTLGFDDIENGRFDEVSHASTAARLARFRDRSPTAACR